MELIGHFHRHQYILHRPVIGIRFDPGNFFDHFHTVCDLPEYGIFLIPLGDTTDQFVKPALLRGVPESLIFFDFI